MKQFYLQELGEKTNFFATEGYIDSAEDEVEFWRKIKSNSDYKYKIFDANTFLLEVVSNSKKFKILFETLVNQHNSTLMNHEKSITTKEMMYILVSEIWQILNYFSLHNIQLLKSIEHENGVHSDTLSTIINFKGKSYFMIDEYPIIQETSSAFKREIYKEFCDLIEVSFSQEDLEKVNDYFNLSTTDKKIVRFYLLNKEFDFLSEKSLPILLKEIRRKEKLLRTKCNLKRIEKTIHTIRELWTNKNL